MCAVASRITHVVILCAAMRLDAQNMMSIEEVYKTVPELEWFNKKEELFRSRRVDEAIELEVKLFKHCNRWLDRRGGVTTANAVGMLQALPVGEAARYESIEVRWSDGFRGVVVLVEKTGHAERVRYMVSSNGAWYIIGSVNVHSDP